jgi:hypothetical protein
LLLSISKIFFGEKPRTQSPGILAEEPFIDLHLYAGPKTNLSIVSVSVVISRFQRGVKIKIKFSPVNEK